MSEKEWQLGEADRDNRFYRRKEDAEEIDGYRQALIDEKAANQTLRAEVARLEADMREIASQCHNLPRSATADRIDQIARRALEGK
jgi:cell division protein FtsB